MIDFPYEIVPLEIETKISQPSFRFTSEFTGADQVIIHPGARWEMKMKFSALSERKARLMRAFLNSIQGANQTVKVYDHSRTDKIALGNPIVSGGGQTGNRLLTMGWIPNQKVIEVGDLFTVNDELKEAKSDCWSDVNGVATIEFNPPLRKSPPNSGPIEIERPYMVARLDDDGVNIRAVACGFIYVDDLNFIEDITK